MAAATDPYSRLVTILKVLLPLIAIGLLSSLFLVQNDNGSGGEITFSAGDLEDLGSGLRVSNPVFSGSSRNADRFRFQADLVVPDAIPPQRADITGLAGEVAFVDGGRLDLVSRRGALDIPAQTLDLEGAVRIETADGYRMETEALRIDLGAGSLSTAVPVTVTGTGGRIEAGDLTVTPTGDTTENRRFLFGNGVRVLYDPPNSGSQSSP